MMRRLLVLLCWLGYTYCTDLTPGNWESCQNGESSASRTNTSARVADLRSKMTQKTLQVYIVPSGNAHLSEFVSDYDKRRQYISGFAGSSGTVVVTQKNAALWTDGRYFLQAEAELGCDWILMRDGEPGVPSMEEWIASELQSSSSKMAGASPYFFGNDEWLTLKASLNQRGIQFYEVKPDLIDYIWTENRPAFPSSTVNALPLKYAGVTWQAKVAATQEEMGKHGADVLVITGLDETAWLFNSRATDIQGFVNDPFFYSVAIIHPNGKAVKLFLYEREKKLAARPSDPATTLTLAEHLNTNINGSCVGRSEHCVEVEEYNWDSVLTYLTQLTIPSSIKRVWISYHTNYAVYDAIPTDKVYVKNTPVTMMKARKNDVEIQGMKNANIRDTVALARFMARVEREVRAYGNWTEVIGMNELAKYRRLQDFNRGDSFAAISSIGPHASIIHYFATEMTDRPITMNETYLLDSGGQYLDGTTDVTRTFLFRDPTAFEKDCYTRVLMGQINLAMATWRKGLYGRDIDAFARKPLWDVGLIFRHGTGHGIGAYLSVHEGPGRISNYHKDFVWDVPLEENMFFSDEPGYYQDGEFGIRLENLVFVKKAQTKYTFPGATMLGMETITFFPYEPHMIDASIMSEEQIAWLNKYHQETLDKIGPMLKEQGDEAAYEWVKKRTVAVHHTSGAAAVGTRNSMLLFSTVHVIFAISWCLSV